MNSDRGQVREEEEEKDIPILSCTKVFYSNFNDNDFDFKLGGNESNQPKSSLGQKYCVSACFDAAIHLKFL